MSMGLRIPHTRTPGEQLLVSGRTACQHSSLCSSQRGLLVLHHSRYSLTQRLKVVCRRQGLSYRRERLGAASRHTVAASASQVAVFPAGRKQAKLTLPAFIIVVSVAEVLRRRDSIGEEIGAAVSAGVTGVLLQDADSLGEQPLHQCMLACKFSRSPDPKQTCHELHLLNVVLLLHFYPCSL